MFHSFQKKTLALKKDKIGQWPNLDSHFCVKTLGILNFALFFYEIFRINSRTEFRTQLDYRIILNVRKKDGQILYSPGEISEIGRQNFSVKFFKNAISKLSVKFSSTLFLKITWENIEKCKSVRVLSGSVLHKNVNRDVTNFVHFKSFCA